MGRKRKIPVGYVPTFMRDSFIESDSDSSLDIPPLTSSHDARPKRRNEGNLASKYTLWYIILYCIYFNFQLQPKHHQKQRPPL